MPQRTTTKPALPQIKPAMLRTFHARLAAWYAAHGRRDLPWRTVGDAYPVWVSEVMLQQTQVSTVLARFYHPFLEKFPTLESLAAAPEQAVLKAWEGLGYYSRARNLHKAAQIVVSHELSVFSKTQPPTIGHNSLTPNDSRLTTLLSLPGIGRNTAHAILAFGYHQPVAILEANVKRVVARIFALKTPSDNELWASAEALLNHAEPFDYNQAMMDIGAMICTPRTPKCGECPANTICRGKASPESYPTKKQKKAVPTRHVTITVMEDATGRLHLTNRGERLLGGLWGFPQEPISQSSSLLPPARMSTGIPACAGMTMIGEVTHTYSHFKLVGEVVHTRTKKLPAREVFTREEITALPLSKLDHKVLALFDAPPRTTQKQHSAKKKAGKTKPVPTKD